MSNIRGPGLTFLSRHSASSAAYSTLSTQLSTQQLTDLRSQLDTFASALRNFASQHRSDILKDPAFREEFQRMCAQIGVDPVGASGQEKVRGVKGMWNNMLGLGDYYYELAVQIVDVCLSTRDVNGGLIDVDDLIARVQRLRSGAAVRGRGTATPAATTPSAISHDDVARAIKTLQPLGCGYTIVDLSSPTTPGVRGAKLVRSLPGALDLDSTLLLSLLASPDCPRDVASGFAYLTEETLMAARSQAPVKGRWARQRARNALRRMCDDEGTLWLDWDEGGGEVRYFTLALGSAGS
ncbi:winged helix DNA-binding domain-containing protein [Jaminaea rosea]|uniref:Winged helix DNA-binding domain-containing protein n=1 Tax=Jaminaea rosea TaxID=1569628 RepID=A0A316UHI2_9BASI|nr:winged helix DNA-binding domain-containing protein [Jaminaea rosea]PWN24736.1 winged helix DNA-binding domain-containing protein [Jaminaea rosea]